MNEIDRIKKVTPENCLAIVNFVVGRLNEPVPNASGIGCVMAAGGKYLPVAYAAVTTLRKHGWQHPIQIWHLGPQEVTEGSRRKFDHLEVEFIDALEVAKHTTMAKLGGWQAKGFAVKNCPFLHVLLLDADSFAERDLGTIFNTLPYHSTGAVITPDIKDNRPHDNIFPMLGLKVPQKFIEGESGQMWIDKVRHWKPVCLMNWMNAHSYFFYKQLHGDKDLGMLSFMKLRVPFALTPACEWVEDGMLHKWFDGRPLTHHACHPKRGGVYRVEVEALIREFGVAREARKENAPVLSVA